MVHIYVLFGLNIKSNVFNHRSFSVQCTIRYYIFVSVFVCIRFLVSFVRFDSFYRWYNLYAHCVCVGWWWFILYPNFLYSKIPSSFLAYLNPKSHFMHRRFKSKCSIFPLSCFTIRLYLCISISAAVNHNKLFGVESQNDKVNGICKHCENIVIAFTPLMNREF